MLVHGIATAMHRALWVCQTIERLAPADIHILVRYIGTPATLPFLLVPPFSERHPCDSVHCQAVVAVGNSTAMLRSTNGIT
jgi:hypothetical protein